MKCPVLTTRHPRIRYFITNDPTPDLHPESRNRTMGLTPLIPDPILPPAQRRGREEENTDTGHMLRKRLYPPLTLPRVTWSDRKCGFGD